jgi:HD-like signal output (HDOD) protein
MQPSELVAETEHLFSLPDIAVRVNTLIDDPHCNSEKLAQLLLLDVGLSATLLKMANSAFYGMPTRVDTVHKAITLVGHKALRDLVVSVAIIRSFKGIPEDVTSMVDFWDNSLVCGILARLLAQKCKLVEPERLFLAGLMHKIGRLVFYASRMDLYHRVLLKGAQGDMAIAAAEREVFGFDYTQLGAELLKAWRFPQMMRTVVALQLSDDPDLEFPQESAILRVAADMAESMSPDIHTGTPTGFYWSEFSPATMQALGMDKGEVLTLMEPAFEQALELIAIINPRR